jgi:choline kinase
MSSPPPHQIRDSPVQRAVILAAGSAKRLKPLTDHCPKCMLEVGGQPILTHQVAALRASGVTQIAVVTGFCVETIHAHLGDEVTHIHNPDYATTNSIYSLWLAREHLAPGGLILNSDVLFHPRALATLIGSPHANCLLYDPEAGQGDPEAMKIAIDDSDGSIERLSKALPDAKTRGENLGVIRLDAEGAGVAAETLDALIASDIRRAWVPEVINEMRPRVRVHPVAVGAPWIEIDTPEDLERARSEVWPQLDDSGSR